MKLFFFFFFLLLVPSVLAYDCSELSNFKECNELNEINESLISNLIYTNSSYPDYNFLEDYNDKLEFSSAPFDSKQHSKGIIKNAWFEIITINPSITYDDVLYSVSNSEVKSEYNYQIELPDNYRSNKKKDNRVCKRYYYLHYVQEDVNFGEFGTGKEINLNFNENITLTGQLTISATKKVKTYKWDKYCCSHDNGCDRWCYKCKYSNTNYETDILNIEDKLDVAYYNHELDNSFVIKNQYKGTTKGVLNKDNESEVKIIFNNSLYEEREFQYIAYFTQEPYYVLNLEANRIENTKIENLLKNDNEFYIKDSSNCYIESNDFFNSERKECVKDIEEIEVEEFNQDLNLASFDLFWKVSVFILINLFIYRLVKKSLGKTLMPFILLILFIPRVNALEECGLTNLASCLPEKMYDFFIGLINAPLTPLLALVRNLMESSPSIELFVGIWAIMVYCLSMFYGILIIYSGFQFILSGHNVLRRQMAKEWFKNTILMITLIQGSYYLYGLVLDLASVMSASVLSLVDETFFLITADNIINIGLEFIFINSYVIVLFLSVLFLVIRYMVVAFGVIFIPLGIFCYFIPPLKTYGKLIMNLLFMFIFVTFVNSVIILGCSMLIQIPLFENLKILVMISCFCIINCMYLILMIHSIKKSLSSGTSEQITQAVKYVGMLV